MNIKENRINIENADVTEFDIFSDIASFIVSLYIKE